MPLPLLPPLCLNNLSVHLREAGRGAEVLAAIEEAVSIYRDLATRIPARFGPDLLRSLNNLAEIRAAMGDHPGAERARAERDALMAE